MIVHAFTVFLFSMLPQMFVVMGHVRDTAGRPVSSIRVSLVDDNYLPIRTVFSDSAGRFEFKGLRSGVYLVRVEPTGTPYEERSERLDLQSMTQRRTTTEEPVMVELVLKYKKGEQPKPEPGVLFWQEVPQAARAEYERGLDSLRKNKSDPGIAALKRSLELFPDYYLALELLGTEYVKREQFPPAVEILTHAVEINPKGARSLYGLGVACLKLSQFQEAIDWLEKSATQDPANINVHMMLGLTYGNVQMLQQSEGSFKKAYQLGGERAADAHLYLAGIYNKLERYADAVRELELYLSEAKDAKDPDKIGGMIQRLRAKEKAKTTTP